MRILEIIPSLASGGAERFVTDLCNEMALGEHNVWLLTFRSGENRIFYKNDLNANVKLLEYSGTWSLWSKLMQFFIVLVYVVRLKPNIIHCHTLGFPYALFASFFFPKIKCFYTVHNLAENDTSPGLGAKVRKVFLKNRIKPIAISHQCALSFLDFYGYNPYLTIENGCRNIHSTDLLNDVKNEIESYKIDSKTKVFVNIARISSQKNHVMLLNAFKSFTKNYENAILIIIGHKSDAWQEVAPMLDDRHVYYLGEKHNVADYLLCSDFFCLSSLWEGLPISLLEAGMLGVCPICTPVGGIIDVISDSSLGFLSEDTTSSSYEATLERAIKSSIDKGQLINAYTERYSMKVCAQKYLNLFYHG